MTSQLNSQVDLFGIAATAYQLQFPQFMKPVYDENSKKYKVPHRRLPLVFDISSIKKFC